MSKRLVYLVDRTENLAGHVTIYRGSVLLNLPNYTRVHRVPVKPDAADENCYALLADEETQLNEVNEVAGEAPTLMLWDGPKDQRSNPASSVTCQLYPLDNPLGAINDEVLAECKELRGANAELTKFNTELTKGRDAQQKKALDLADRLGMAEDTLREQREEIATLQNQLLKVQGGAIMENMTVKTMAEIMHSCPDAVIEALPHIGPGNLKNVRKWAEEELAKPAE